MENLTQCLRICQDDSTSINAILCSQRFAIDLSKFRGFSWMKTFLAFHLWQVFAVHWSKNKSSRNFVSNELFCVHVLRKYLNFTMSTWTFWHFKKLQAHENSHFILFAMEFKWALCAHFHEYFVSRPRKFLHRKFSFRHRRIMQLKHHKICTNSFSKYPSSQLFDSSWRIKMVCLCLNKISNIVHAVKAKSSKFIAMWKWHW